MIAATGGTMVPSVAAGVPAKKAAKKPAAKKAAVSPEAKAVAALIREDAGGWVKKLYAARGFWPIWASDGRIGPEADALVDMLESADLDGLKPGDYHVGRLRETIAAAKTGGPAQIARADLALSEAFGDYGADMRRPAKVGMRVLDPELKPERTRPEAVLRAATLRKAFGSYITGMEWMNPHYVRLRTLAAKAGPADRDRLRLNMDRARILPGPWTRHIVVDAATARLYYYEGGKQQGTMRVVVGTPETQTPMLIGMVRYAILNPYWNVPTDLAQTKFAPRVLKGASLASMRMEALSDYGPDATKLDPKAVDWHAVASGERQIRLRQLPGSGNAMGRMKFMFPNDLGIYLHDTSERALLTKSDRYFSNGCVRLEDAPRLGRWMFGKSLTAVTKRPEQDLPLMQPVPVYLTYLTAVSTDRGLAFVKDVYGRDG